MSREPTFGDDLPEALKDKPASDPAVIAHFQQKAVSVLTQQRDAYEARLADARRPLDRQEDKKPVKPSNADWFQDPNASVTKVAPSREEFSAMTEMMQRTAIQNAEMITRGKFKDFSKFEADVMKIMNALDPGTKADPQNWNTAYFAVKGMASDRLIEEEVGKVRTQMSAESNTSVEVPEPAKTPLSGDQKTIIQRLGITEEKYRKAEVQNRGQVWPAVR